MVRKPSLCQSSTKESGQLLVIKGPWQATERPRIFSSVHLPTLQMAELRFREGKQLAQVIQVVSDRALPIMVHPQRQAIWFAFQSTQPQALLPRRRVEWLLDGRQQVSYIWPGRVDFFHRALRLKELETGLSGDSSHCLREGSEAGNKPSTSSRAPEH